LHTVHGRYSLHGLQYKKETKGGKKKKRQELKKVRKKNEVDNEKIKKAKVKGEKFCKSRHFAVK
jgi:hypothetical protein